MTDFAYTAKIAVTDSDDGSHSCVDISPTNKCGNTHCKITTLDSTPIKYCK